MQLNASNLSEIKSTAGLQLPTAALLQLPEKVLQFGTGVLLRGLTDLVIHQANMQGRFNGRIVVVKSTSHGNTTAFDHQNGLYTVCIRGLQQGEKISSEQVVSSISRVLTATQEWDEIMACAENPEMEVIISNTTEMGITLTKDNVHASPPQSFPGKLLAFLYKRFKTFHGDADKGMVIVPTELIPDNADKLLGILLELAHQNGLEVAFIDWLENANKFCNSLVDRIVPGKLSAQEQKEVESKLGFEDALTIMSECYVLWAIQSDAQKVHDILSFATPGSGVIIAPNIDKFRELKLRLLNGSHTFTCGLAILAGFDTVKDAMANPTFSDFITSLMKNAIVPTLISDDISKDEAITFSENVLDRYSNPFLQHHWHSITLQYSSKMYMRNMETISKSVSRFGTASPLMTLGMAAHILYMRCSKVGEEEYQSETAAGFSIMDENAAKYAAAWQADDAAHAVDTILSDEAIWQADLTALPQFATAVKNWVTVLQNEGAMAAMRQAVAQHQNVVNEK